MRSLPFPEHGGTPPKALGSAYARHSEPVGRTRFTERGYKIPWRPIPLNVRDIKGLFLAKLCFQSNRCFGFGVHSCFFRTESIARQLWVRKGTDRET